MKNAFVDNLYRLDYNVSSIFAMRQTWPEGHKFTMPKPRPTNALLLFTDARALCELKNGSILEFSRGDLALLPADSQYVWHFSTDNGAPHTTMLFEFLLFNPEGTPVLPEENVSMIDSGYGGIYRLYFEKLISEFSRPVRIPAAIKESAYALLACVSRRGHEASLSLTGFECIKKGIRYFEDDVRLDKSIAEIAGMCNVSVNYFEKLFKSYFGKTPTEYRIEKKLDRAELLLKTGNMTIEQIACELGFCDSAYLSRIYKKKRGISPGKIGKLK